MARTEHWGVKIAVHDIAALIHKDEGDRGNVVIGEITFIIEQGPWESDRAGGGPGPQHLAGAKYNVRKQEDPDGNN